MFGQQLFDCCDLVSERITNGVHGLPRLLKSKHAIFEPEIQADTSHHFLNKKRKGNG